MAAIRFGIHQKYSKSHLTLIQFNRSSSSEAPFIPTNAYPHGFRAYDRPIQKESHQINPKGFQAYDPFKIRGIHKRAKTKNGFDFDAKEEFSIHPIWTPLVPLLTIGIGIYIIVSGVIAHPPGDDDDDD